MTLAVGKNQFHIGFWETGILIAAIVSCTWGASAVVNAYNDKQQKMSDKQDRMYEKINYIARIDSIHFGSIDTSLQNIKARQAADERLLSTSINTKKPVTHYYTENNAHGLKFQRVK